MKKVYLISAFLILFLGLIHTAMTPVFYPAFSLDSLWFAGAGLALVFLGSLNYFASKIMTKLILNVCIIANIILTIYLSLISVLLPEIHAFIGVILMLCLLVGAVWMRIQ